MEPQKIINDEIALLVNIEKVDNNELFVEEDADLNDEVVNFSDHDFHFEISVDKNGDF